MASESYEFTSTEEMNNFEDGDTAMELTGYVDAIEGMKEVKTHQGRVFKFILNNGDNRRMRVLLWGGDALKYKDKITMYQIINLTMGTIRAMNTRFPVPPGDNYVLTEFHVQTASSLQCYGVYKKDSSQEKHTEVALESINSVSGRICTEVFIRTPFKTVTTASEIQALGLTVDHAFKLPVGIVNFIPNDELKPGTCVRISGVVDRNKMGGGFFKITDMTGIEINHTKTMSVSDMKKIAVSALSKRRSEGALPSSKRNKENESHNNMDKDKME